MYVCGKQSTTPFRLHLQMPFFKMMAKWCKLHKVDPHSAHFHLSGREVHSDDTPEVCGWSLSKGLLVIQAVVREDLAVVLEALSASCAASPGLSGQGVSHATEARDLFPTAAKAHRRAPKRASSMPQRGQDVNDIVAATPAFASNCPAGDPVSTTASATSRAPASEEMATRAVSPRGGSADVAVGPLVTEPLGGTLRVATDCSGMEAPILELRALGVNHRHVFSCEVDGPARRTIHANFRPEVMYENLLHRDHAVAPKADLYLSGFP